VPKITNSTEINGQNRNSAETLAHLFRVLEWINLLFMFNVIALN